MTDIVATTESNQTSSRDDSASLTNQVLEAVGKHTALCIVGGDSKSDLGQRVDRQAQAELNTLSHRGIIAYEPTELVVSVRAGTRMSELSECLDSAGQMLAFEPPLLPQSTIGGVLACGQSGPRRPFSGSARDYVLGTRILNGQGQDLAFGGEVMKNVAGYDVSRLQVGAWGTLGLILDVSMKVLPRPEMELTLVHESRAEDYLPFASFMRKPLPLSGAMLIDQQRFFRLSGSESAVRSAAQILGGDVIDSDTDIWTQVRDHRHPFFSVEPDSGSTLWRISVSDHAPALGLSGRYLFEWGGAQRWLVSDLPAIEIYEAAAAAGGHAMRFSRGETDEPAFQPLNGPMRKLQTRLRDSFDPQRLFNRGRFHPELDHPAAKQI